MKRLLPLLALLLPLACLAQAPGVGLDTLNPANALAGGELLFGYQAGSGGSGALACARGWCPVSVTPLQLRAFGMAATGGSLQGNGASATPVQLIGDIASPGNSMLYGTNGFGVKGWYAQAGGGGGSSAFDAITSGSNTSATMVVSSGAALGPSGSGVLSANQVNGAAVPISAALLSTNGSGQLLPMTLVPAANGGTGVANSFTATFGGALVTAGPFATSGSSSLTLTTTGATNATLPAGTVSLGYLGVPQNSQALGYTLLLTDAGKHIYNTNTGASTDTIPANGTVAFPIGTTVTFVNCPTCANETISITTDTMYWSTTGVSAGTTGSRTLAPFGTATILKVTATSWYISGPGVS
jgi:hypothetical protein